MIDDFKIYIDRLKDGHEQDITGSFSPDFLDVQEAELSFPHLVKIQGKAYVLKDHLILQLKVETLAEMPCKICSKRSLHKILLESFYHTEELVNIKNMIFDFSEVLREEILLEVPPFIECQNNQCPERDKIKSFLKQSKGDMHFPFNKLNTKE
ncbi:MAG: hypothetical protein PVI40_07470 [Chlamydiota bacterium]|jgi:hypothetical protein